MIIIIITTTTCKGLCSSEILGQYVRGKLKQGEKRKDSLKRTWVSTVSGTHLWKTGQCAHRALFNLGDSQPQLCWALPPLEKGGESWAEPDGAKQGKALAWEATAHGPSESLVQEFLTLIKYMFN